MRHKTIFLVFLFALATSAQAWTRFDGATLVDDPRNDGDSFIVQTADGTLHARLYFVDCTETWDGAPYQRRRLREQARYFGLESVAIAKQFGEVATERTRELLREPFTLYTVFHATPGQRETPRYYSVIQLSDGRDLAEVLVQEGLARRVGVQREMPDGRSVAEMNARFEDLQLAAIIKRRGIWRESDPDLLPALRAERRRQREEEAAYLKERAEILAGSLNLNYAELRELTMLPGIGGTTAQRIVEHRPFASMDDLLRVPGIGPVTLNRIRPHVHVN